MIGRRRPVRTGLTGWLAALFLTLGLAAHTAWALDRVQPEAVGLASPRASAFKAELQRRVDAGEMPGAVLLVARRGQVAVHEAVGFQDRATGTPMRPDSIFRIASMTKPLVSVGVMMLAEQGKLLIYEPVWKYLPDFKDVKVAVERVGNDGRPQWVLEPPRRAITIQDLLRHTAGLTYGRFDQSHVDELYLKADLFNRDQTLAEQVRKLATLPLKHQPGTTFDYSLAVDVLGRLIEVISGQTLDVFIQERITRPLGMVDTGFWVEADKLPRLAQPQLDPATGKPTLDLPVHTRPKLINGGGGMVSTAADYARFCQMMMNGGVFEGRRYLSRKTVELMTSNHLPPATQYTHRVQTVWGSLSVTPEHGTGFGLGFAVRVDPGRSTLPGSVGEFLWSGSSGTNFVVDPREQLTLILLTQQPNRMFDYLALMRQMGHAMVAD